MKKIVKIICCLMLFFIVGCSESTEEQEKVVNNFFEYIKECDIAKLKTVASEDIIDDMQLEDMEESLSAYTEEEFGKVFVEETNKFKVSIFSGLFSDVKIGDVTVDGDETTVKVKCKQKDYTKVSFNQSSINSATQEFINNNKDDLMKVYQEQGLKAYQIKIYDGIAPVVYQNMIDEYNKVESTDLDSTFVLEKEDGKWIITDIKE